MSFLLDTDICSAHLRGDTRIYQRMLQYGGPFHVSAATLAELKVWLYRSRTPPRFAAVMNAFMADTSTIAIDAEVADVAGRIGASLRDAGRVIGFSDLLIAATGQVYDLAVVTHNTRHFSVVPNLRICDWLDE
jgi:tRNA(fMet)-specific endonuclease VapC